MKKATGPMQPSNDPHRALVQEWCAQLDAWIDANGLGGFDPFDVKQHPWIRRAQYYPLARKATTALCDRFPNAARRALGIQPTHNAKAYALVAMGKMRLHELTQEARYLDQARAHLDWLLEHATPDQPGLCWGYPFDIEAKGLHTPAGTPIGVVCAIAGDAFYRFHALTGEPAYADHAVSVARFLLEGLPRLDSGDGSYCFAYTPSDRRRVHNANLLVVEHLLRAHALTGDAAFRVAALPALEFTLARQRGDGAWAYGDWHEGDPYEKGLLSLIDHHHTGYVLRSLHAIGKLHDDDRIGRAVRKGFAYYKEHLFEQGTWAPVNGYGKFPVDIHACAEGILCPSVLSDDVLGARGIATFVVRWTWFYLRDRDTNAPWYRLYPGFTSKIIYPRWGVAWLYWALTECLSAERAR
ncbi:MAG: hypothetical protein GC168_16555 [Candidatus Hydrogenedens sp.]|nr:hypothetical protein [Candidatus Hydrogenedens sp.]